ncbi:MAG: class I SAM-dependent methyltransferase [Chthoniobacterales bacterium]|nr:class I SAM-dependent methyltransferase [Chthoniobacterales bacterium]
MNNITKSFRDHYGQAFGKYGATSRGVDWGDEGELQFRYEKFFSVIALDPGERKDTISILDVGCGWGGFCKFLQERVQGGGIDYTGIDIVPEMIQRAREEFPSATFHQEDLFSFSGKKSYDYVVCNGVLTQKLSATIPDMEEYANRMVLRMFELCKKGIVFNHMSSKVNYMVSNLYYRNPLEVLSFCLAHLSPRVLLDHSFVSTNNPERNRLFDYIVYVFKDPKGGGA